MYLIDHQVFVLQIYGGISRYFYELMKSKHGNKYYRIPFFHRNRYILKLSFGKYIYIGRLAWIFRDFFNFVNQKIIIWAYKRGKIKAVHATFFDCDYLINNKIPYFLTIYDLIDEETNGVDKNSKRYGAIQNAQKIIFISNGTKRSFKKFYPHASQETKVIYLSNTKFNSKRKNNVSLVNKKEIIVGYVGVRNGHKNFNVICEALSRLTHVKVKIVCFAGPRFTNNDRRMHSKYGLNVTRIKGDDNDLTTFLESVDMLIYPSLLEGFGIPPLEAMSVGTPVLASNKSCIPEICRDGAIYFNPLSPEDLKKTFLEAISKKKIIDNVIRKGFNVEKLYSWENCASSTLDFYKSNESN